MNKVRTTLNPTFKALSSFIETIQIRFSDSTELVYSGRNQLKRFEVDGMNLVVKSFRIPILLNRIAYTFFRQSKAQRSYENSLQLAQLGIPTPAPVAYVVEYQRGLIGRSYYICEQVQTCEKAEWYFHNDLNIDQFYQQLAKFIADFQAKGVWHEDLSPGNILVCKHHDGYTFSIVDTNRMKFRSLSDREKLKNFIRLFPRREASTLFARHYARYRQLNEEQTVEAINCICDRFFGEKVIRWAKAKIRKEQGVWSSLFGPIQQYQFFRLVRRLFQLDQSSSIAQKERCLYEDHIQHADPRLLYFPRY